MVLTCISFLDENENYHLYQVIFYKNLQISFCKINEVRELKKKKKINKKKHFRCKNFGPLVPYRLKK